MNNKSNRLSEFFNNYVEDFFILFGIILIVVATLIVFSFGIALYVMGIFLIMIGFVDPHDFKKGR